jgi:hypothetical protein
VKIVGVIVEAVSPVRALLAEIPKLLKRKDPAQSSVHVQVSGNLTISGSVGDITGVRCEEDPSTSEDG